MIVSFFTIIVFIAELIICFSAVYSLIKLDKHILSTNEFLKDVNPKIKNIMELAKGISEQLPQLINLKIEDFNRAKEKFIIEQLKNLFATFLFWKINIRFINKIRKSKIAQLIMKGFNLMQNMV